jgi:hypothetical protein
MIPDMKAFLFQKTKNGLLLLAYNSPKQIKKNKKNITAVKYANFLYIFFQ